MTTLVVGESLVDVVRPADGGPPQEHVGGSPLNVAVGLARLGHDVVLATSMADDERGRRISAHLERDDVRLAPGSTSASRTSTAEATLDADGSARYTFDITWQAPPLGLPSQHLHTGSIGAVLRPGGEDVLTAMAAHREHATISYDPNPRPALMGAPAEVIGDIEARIALSDVVKASDEDIAWLTGQSGASLPVADLVTVLRSWRAKGATLAVATRGPDGAVAVLPDGSVVEVPGATVEVVDTVGAGDSFTSALLGALLDVGLLGGPLTRQRLATADPHLIASALARAVAASAITVSRAGADPPTTAELDQS